MKRLFSLLAALALVLTMVPAVSLAAEARTVYLDPVSGADTNTGLTEAAPVQTVEAAYTALNGADEGVLVLLDTLTLAEATTFPSCDIPVTITGGEIQLGGHLFLGGDTTLDNMTLTLTASNNTTYLSAEGFDLTIGENVVSKVNGSYRLCLTGRYGEGSVDGVTLTVKSGSWRNIFPGGYKYANTGDAALVMTGGDVNNLVGPTYSGTVTGNITMDISGAKITAICAAPNETGAVNGNVDITLGDGVTGKLRIKRLYKNAAVNGTVTATIDGDCSGLSTIAHEGAGEGTVTETRLVLKSGVLDVTPCAFDSVSVQIPTGKTLTLSDCDITADTVDSQGTLVFSGAASLTADAITGSLDCAISGDAQEGHTYVTAPAGSSVTFPADSGVTETDGQWQTPGAFDEAAFQGLVLRAAPDVTVKLYTGYTSGSVVTPTHTVEGDTLNSYYYAISSGNYRYIASGTGYYKTTQNVYMSAAEAATLTEINATPDKMAGSGTDNWETGTVKFYTDETHEIGLNNDLSQWPAYADVFTTPWFTESHGTHQMTTQAQAETFIRSLDDTNDNMYIFTAGTSAGYGYDVLAVFFTETDLSKATTVEEAAALMGQDKPTVLYRAQVHGNEPAAGEAALAMVQRLDGAYGEGLIENINICVLPRANPDGSRNYNRHLANGIDPNRDTLRAKSQEITDYLRLYRLLEPEMVIDGHEYSVSTTTSYMTDGDMTVGMGFTVANGEDFIATSKAMLANAFADLDANGLNHRYYSNALNTADANISRAYTGQQGTLFMLIETRGIGVGMDYFARRVVSQVVAAESALDYVAENAEQIQKTVDSERQRIVQMGATYEESDAVILETTKSEVTELAFQMHRFYQNGTESDVESVPKVYDQIARSRTAPTAYVIPAGATFTDEVLALMDKHGITYTYIPEGSTLLLQQYTGTATEAGLTAEQSVTFGQGAYVFCKNQEKGITLSMLMEPDVTDLATYSGTLAQQGVITPVGGCFPIYRYCHDLNADGFINYTLSDAEPAHVTVYLDGTNGDDTADGLTESTAVKTLAQAYAAMAAALNAAGSGSTGTLVVTGLYDLGAQQIHLPSVSFPVTITGKTADDGLSFTGGTGDAQIDRAIHLHGDTTFQNVTLHVNNSYTYNYIFANGHKLVMGENVNTTVKKANCYFAISGGSVNYGDQVASVDVTIRSGTWKMIYLGGYYGDVSGVAKLDISNASVLYSIVASYRGNVGSLQMNISNTGVSTYKPTDTTHGIFAGTYTSNSKYDCGKVLGDATIVLGENVTAPAVHGTARVYGHVYGDTTIIADGVDLSAVPVKARYSGLSASYPTRYVELQLAEDVTQNVTVDPALVLDLNGYDITGSVTVDGTLTVKDSQTDDYTVADGIYGKITGTVTGSVAAAEGYIAVDGQSFHRFSQHISGVSLRPGMAGIYYDATWNCDEVLAESIDTFGVAVSLADLPGADFATDEDTLYTAFDSVVSGKPQTSVMIANILKGEADDIDRAIEDIYAACYVTLADGTVLVSENEIAYSLFDVVKLLDENYYAQYQDSLESFYKTWESLLCTWNLTNIGK